MYRLECAVWTLFLQIKKSVSDFAKTADKPAAEKVNAEEGVYYLVNPEGEFERAFGHDVDSLAIALAVGACQLCSSALRQPGLPDAAW